MKRAQRRSGTDQAGWVLLELLLCCAVLGVLTVTAVPAVHEMYLEAAVEYETECLYSDIRQLQVLSRTTSSIYAGSGRFVRELRMPSLALGATDYRLRQGTATFKKHECLPGVQLLLKGRNKNEGDGVAFNDESWPATRLMTIYVFAEGHRDKARSILISNGRVRVERGKGT